MNISTSVILTVNGLFDFDLTFPIEALFFLILSLVITNFFLSPISKQIDERSFFIEYTLEKSIILLNLGYEKFINSIAFLTQETSELNRQLKLIKNESNQLFEYNLNIIQNKNVKLLKTLQKDLMIKSAYLLSNLTKDITYLLDEFFAKK
eukprot:gene23741-gene16326